MKNARQRNQRASVRARTSVSGSSEALGKCDQPINFGLIYTVVLELDQKRCLSARAILMTASFVQRMRCCVARVHQQREGGLQIFSC